MDYGWGSKCQLCCQLCMFVKNLIGGARNRDLSCPPLPQSVRPGRYSNDWTMPTRLGSSYSRKRSLGQGNIFTSIYDSFYSRWGGGLMSLPVVMVSTSPWTVYPNVTAHTHPWTAHPESTLPGQHHPGQHTSFLAHPHGQHTPQSTSRAVRILLEYFLVLFEFSYHFQRQIHWQSFFFHSGW